METLIVGKKFDENGNYISTEKYYKGKIFYYRNSNGDFWYDNIIYIKDYNENKEINKKENKEMKELKDTVEAMNSNDYKSRFIAEYQQTKIRYEKLKNFCNRIEVARMTHNFTAEPDHDCPLELLREQQKYMGLYLSCLEKRAIIEKINLDEYK